ncbi:MAG: hypothetical protein XXXNARYT_003002 [Candidatus Accumulibacter regalis]|jgi:hypothetical protein
MVKLFDIREWLTVVDAARHLSIVFGEAITEADVLRLALDGTLRLSVFFADHVDAKRAHIPEWRSARSGDNSKSKRVKDWMLHVEEGEVVRIVGVLNLPMIGSERLEVENEYRRLINGEALEIATRSRVCVENNGQLYALQEQLPNPVWPEVDPSVGPFEKFDQFDRADAMTNYSQASTFPQHRIFVVRTAALSEFEASLSGRSAGLEKPLITTERNTLLTIIAALCDYGDIKHQERGAARQLAKLTDEIGASVSDDTIRDVLRKIPDALRTRMK